MIVSQVIREIGVKQSWTTCVTPILVKTVHCARHLRTMEILLWTLMEILATYVLVKRGGKAQTVKKRLICAILIPFH